MIRWLALIVPALLLSGCLKTRTKYDRTPAGWHVHWIENGTQITGRHTKLELLNLFDAAMERAFDEAAAKVGTTREAVRSKARDNDALYTLVDNFYFPVIGGPAADAPNAQFASGETLDRVEVWIAFYNKQGPALPADVPADAPPWTLKDSTSFPGKVYWGAELEGQQYPALGYELHWLFTNIP